MSVGYVQPVVPLNSEGGIILQVDPTTPPDNPPQITIFDLNAGSAIGGYALTAIAGVPGDTMYRGVLSPTLGGGYVAGRAYAVYADWESSATPAAVPLGVFRVAPADTSTYPTVVLADGVTHAGTTAIMRLQTLSVINPSGNGIVAQGSSNGISAIGAGTGSGIRSTGAAGTGPGITVIGGAGSPGILSTGGTDAAGMRLVGTGTGMGLYCIGGASGYGLFAEGVTAGIGVNSNTGSGVLITANSGIGFHIVGGTRGISASGTVGAFFSGGTADIQLNNSTAPTLSAAILTNGSINSTVAPNLDAAVSSRATPADVNTQVLDVMTVDTFGEPSGAPGLTVSLAEKIGRQYQVLRNRLTVTANAKTFYSDGGVTPLWSKPLSDDGTTYSEGEGI